MNEEFNPKFILNFTPTGIIPTKAMTPPYYFNLLLGNIACAQADLVSLGLMLKEVPEGSHWEVSGIGNSQLTMNAMAFVAEGGGRVGMEDNIYYDLDRTRLPANRDLVARHLVVAKVLQREPYSPKEARTVLLHQDA